MYWAGSDQREKLEALFTAGRARGARETVGETCLGFFVAAHNLTRMEPKLRLSEPPMRARSDGKETIREL
jgi:hypothetical protein